MRLKKIWIIGGGLPLNPQLSLLLDYRNGFFNDKLHFAMSAFQLL